MLKKKRKARKKKNERKTRKRKEEEEEEADDFRTSMALSTYNTWGSMNMEKVCGCGGGFRGWRITKTKHKDIKSQGSRYLLAKLTWIREEAEPRQAQRPRRVGQQSD